MGLIINVAPCAVCVPEVLPTQLDACDLLIKEVGPEVIALWFLCDTELTDDWATLADIITDLTAITPLAVATKMRWAGKPKKERTSITLAAGLDEIPVSWTQAIELFSDMRDQANVDYDFYNDLIDLSVKQRLRLAYVTQSDDLYMYKHRLSLAQSDDIQELESVEQINLSVSLKGPGYGMLKPTYLAGAFDAISAVI